MKRRNLSSTLWTIVLLFTTTNGECPCLQTHANVILAWLRQLISMPEGTAWTISTRKPMPSSHAMSQTLSNGSNNNSPREREKERMCGSYKIKRTTKTKTKKNMFQAQSNWNYPFLPLTNPTFLRNRLQIRSPNQLKASESTKNTSIHNHQYVTFNTA